MRIAAVLIAVALVLSGASRADGDRVADVRLGNPFTIPEEWFSGPALSGDRVAWARHVAGRWEVLARAPGAPPALIANLPTPSGVDVAHDVVVQGAPGALAWEERAYRVISGKYQIYDKVFDRLVVARGQEAPRIVAGCEPEQASCEASCPEVDSYAGVFAWTLASEVIAEIQRCGSPKVRVRDLASPDAPPHEVPASSPPATLYVVISPEPVVAAGRLLGALRDGHVVVYDSATLEERSAIALPEDVRHWDLDADGSLAFATKAGRLLYAGPSASEPQLLRGGVEHKPIRLRAGRVAAVLDDGPGTALAVVDAATRATRIVARYRRSTIVARSWIGLDRGEVIGLDFDGRTISWAWRQCDLVHVERIGADQPTMPAPKPRDCGVPRVVSPRPRLSVRGRLVLHVVCARGCRARVRVGDETHTASLPPRRATQRLLVAVSRANRHRAFTLRLAGGGVEYDSRHDPSVGDGQMRRIATIGVYAANRARAVDRAAGRRGSAASA